jgi:hypothetical protein
MDRRDDRGRRQEQLGLEPPVLSGRRRSQWQAERGRRKT